MINEQDWTNFMDLMVSRCKNSIDAYYKLSNFVEYLDYSESLYNSSKEFKSLFDANSLNPIVEGKLSTFTKVFEALKKGEKINLKGDEQYSGLRIDTKDFPGHIFVSSKLKRNRMINESLKAEVLRVTVSCGRSSTYDRCGNSSHSSCGYSRPSNRCGSSSSSCGSQVSRC